MERKHLFLISAILFILIIIAAFVFKPTHFRADKSRIQRFEASEGTDEDPFARTRFVWQKLHDPITNEIPKNIGTQELAFVRKLTKQADKHYPVTSNWINRGPYNIGGRTKALALDIKDENIILAGCVSSGMWKSTDGGKNWRKTTAPDQLHSVSCIAQNRTSGQESIWYYGTGEWAPSGRGGSAAIPIGQTNTAYRGDGIFKSIDGGDSWTTLPSTVSGTADITDPFDFIWGLTTFGENGVFAATSTGLFKSINGGDSWEHVLNFGENYPNTEIAKTDSNIFYATIGGNGPDNGIYKSTDGEIWENISPPDWPDTTKRTVIGIAPSNDKIVYFFTCKDHRQTLLKKYEEGVGWTDLTVNLPWEGEMITYSGNMLLLKIKPDDENTLFLGTVGMYRSADGGQSFEVIGAYGSFHVDQHSLVFMPSDPKAMIVGNDGGLFKTENNIAEVTLDPTTGEYRIEWESLNNGYLTTQFYSVSIDHETPGSEIISGGMQDNGCMVTFSTDPQFPWEPLIWGDGGFITMSDSGNCFYTSLAATFRVWRHTFPNGEHRWTDVTPTATKGGSIWLPPFILDAFDNRIMYLPWRFQLWRNSDLTEIPYKFPPTPTDMNWSQLVNVKDQYISALGMSKAEPKRLYYGSIYGNLFRLDNPHEGQPVPVEITGSNFTYGAYIHCIAVDPRDANKVLVVFPNYGINSIYASEDGGNYWIPVSGNLEENYNGTGCGPSVRWVSILYVQDKPVYFAGTSVGLFSSTNLDGMNTTWLLEGAESIGNLVIDMIEVRQSDGFVVVGTHGNGVYSTYVTEIPSAVEEKTSLPTGFKLFPAYPNPFNNATTICFSLPFSGPTELKVYNVLGEEVSTLINRPLQEGEHDFRWTAEGLASGTYLVRLTFGNYSESQKVLLQK